MDVVGKCVASRRRILVSLAGALMLGVVITLAIRDDRGLDALRALNVRVLALVAAILVFYFPVYAARFLTVLHQSGNVRVGYIAWFRLLIVARFLNVVAPQLGNLNRGFRLKRDHSISYEQYLASYVAFAWLDVVSALILAAIVLATSVDQSVGGWSSVGLTVTGIAVIIALPIMARTLGARSVLALGRWNSSVATLAQRYVSRVVSSLGRAHETIASGRMVLMFVVWSLVLAGMMGAAMWLLFREMSEPVGFSEIALLYALYRLTAHINITPGNLGIREFAYGLLGAQLGAPMAVGVLVSTVIRLLSYVVLLGWGVALGGVGYYAAARDQFRSEANMRSPRT